MDLSKLGITKAPWEADVRGNVYSDNDTGERIARCENDYMLISSDEANRNAQLIATAPEMLEALILQCRWFDSQKSWGNFDSKYHAFLQRQIPVIQKATGKSWEEVKGLLNENNMRL